MARNDGGPAFPRASHTVATPQGVKMIAQTDGLSLRDWFAGMALGALRSQIITMLMSKDGDVSKAAEVAYKIADAMLAERERSGG